MLNRFASGSSASPFPLRYLFAAHPQATRKVLGIVYRAISTHLIQKAGFSLKDGATGAVTLIQRFVSALNLNTHFHILFLDGVYVYRDNRPPRFRCVKVPDKSELEDLVQLISQRALLSNEWYPTLKRSNVELVHGDAHELLKPGTLMARVESARLM